MFDLVLVVFISCLTKNIMLIHVKNLPATELSWFDSWVRNIQWRRDRLPTPIFWVYLVAQLVKNPPTMQERPGFDRWAGKILWRRERLPTPVLWPGEFHEL